MTSTLVLLDFFCTAQELAEAEKEERKLRRDGDSKKVKLEEEAGSSAAAADVDGSIALDTQPSGLDER